jgi:outer membrane receptor for Fe3+-dicitrate
MDSQRTLPIGLEYLLDLNGNVEVQNEAGYWVKMEVLSVHVTNERPQGIRYSLTLHAPDNTRLIGFDNAHSVKPVGSRFKHAGKRFPYDHRHRHALDEGVLYEFDTAYQLVSDFYAEVDRVLKEVSS